jgi:adenylylsulfate kinase
MRRGFIPGTTRAAILSKNKCPSFVEILKYAQRLGKRAGICLHGHTSTGKVRRNRSFRAGDRHAMNGTSSTGFTVWFTGMSGAGKSTLATALANRLRRLGKTVEVLDGGEVDQFLNVGHGQTKDERNLEARKLAWVCRLITRGGGIVLQAAIESPYKETRDEARRQIGRFAEIFVECPIETLIQRDKSGKYKKALAGELRNLVGISEPYEPPQHPEVIVDTSKMTVDEAVEHILGQLVAQRLVDPALAAMKGRPKISARGKPSPRPAAVPAPAHGKQAKAPKAPAKPRKAVKVHKKAAPKQRAAARTARAEPRRAAAGGKRKR